MEQIEIKDVKKQLAVTESCIDGSKFIRGSLQHLYFEDINMSGPGSSMPISVILKSKARN
jgi:hypothetical protein